MASSSVTAQLQYLSQWQQGINFICQIRSGAKNNKIRWRPKLNRIEFIAITLISVQKMNEWVWAGTNKKHHLNRITAGGHVKSVGYGQKKGTQHNVTVDFFYSQLKYWWGKIAFKNECKTRQNRNRHWTVNKKHLQTSRQYEKGFLKQFSWCRRIKSFQLRSSDNLKHKLTRQIPCDGNLSKSRS